jgi:hypothetical protein
VGETVFAIGNPLGSYSNTFTSGMINKLDVGDILGNVNNYDPQNNPVGDMNGYAFVHMIQFDAGATHGNSGGPLLDKDGKVIGIIDSGEPDAEFIHFATPLIVLKTVIPNLITNGVYKHPWIGVEGIDVQNGGCKIVQTDPKSPLSKVNNGMSDRTNSLVHTKASPKHDFLTLFHILSILFNLIPLQIASFNRQYLSMAVRIFLMQLRIINTLLVVLLENLFPFILIRQTWRQKLGRY